MARPKQHIKKAATAYEDFSGHAPQKVKTAKLDNSDVAGWQMGPVVGIAYEARRDNQTERYFHEFKPAARPRLVARSDGKQLYIVGGRYKVTNRGIEDMPQLFVVNPSPRKRTSSTSRGKTPTTKKRAKPMARRRRRTASRTRRQVAVFNANPVRRRRRRTVARRRSFRRNPAVLVARRNPIRRRRRTTVRRYRRNPSARAAATGFGKLFIPAAGIGLGAVGAEIIMGYLPIPANFKTGVLRHVTKGVVGIAAGMAIGKILRQKRLGNFIALGAVVIAVHDGVKEFIANSMPSIHMGQYRGPIRSSLGGMGYTNPGSIARLGQYTQTPASSLRGVASAHGGGGETTFAV